MNTAQNGAYFKAVPFQNDDRFQVAIKVAEILGVGLKELTGFVDTDAKIISICIEMAVSARSSMRELSKKYNINESYLSHRLAELKQRCKKEEALRNQLKAVCRAFNI